MLCYWLPIKKDVSGMGFGDFSSAINVTTSELYKRIRILKTIQTTLCKNVANAEGHGMHA